MKINYIQNIIYYFLDLLGTLLNFLCSLVRFYPKLELGLEYLMRKQESFMLSQNSKQGKRRSSNLKQADKKFSDAKDLAP